MNINPEEYENDLPHPRRPQKPNFVGGATPEELREWADILEQHNANDEDQKYRVAMRTYNAESARLVEQFKQDAFLALGITAHSKRDMVFTLAWKFGHYDFRETWNLLQVLADLMSPETRRKKLCPDCGEVLKEFVCNDCHSTGTDPDDIDELAECSECDGQGHWTQCEKCDWLGDEYGA